MLFNNIEECREIAKSKRELLQYIKINNNFLFFAFNERYIFIFNELRCNVVVERTYNLR